jgi:hypothetical protein
MARSPAGDLVRPDDAVAGAEYRCPGCGAAVVLRRGTARRAHFAHRSGEGCSTESVLHRSAKAELVRVITEWKRGRGPRPCISRSCPRLGCEGGAVQDLPDDVTHAEAEVRLGSGVVADVVLFRGSAIAAAVEVLVTHGVGHEKAARLGVPWVELRAEDILDRPYWWVAGQDGLQPLVCPRCAERDEERAYELRAIRERAIRVADRLGLELPPAPPYQAVAHVCWRCGADMLAYTWPGAGHSPARPPSPIPATLQHRVTDGAGNYWANCCPRCSAVQGDYYLARDNRDFSKLREGPG